MINKPGIYKIGAEAYHADPVETPSLSSSIARTLLNRSPLHAWMECKRLNPDYEDVNNKQFDIGHAAHSLLLEGSEEKFVLIDAENYKKKDAQEARDAAWASDKIPLLPDQLKSVRDMVDAMRRQLAHHEEGAGVFRDGTPEQTFVWQEGGAWCRCRPDWTPTGGNVFHEYKTTGTSAHPDDWVKHLYNMGYDMQAAHYRKGIRSLLNLGEVHYRFVVQETAAPYAISIVELDPASMDMAERKVDRAISLWAWCLEHDRWPGYPQRVSYLTAPSWEEYRWGEREAAQPADPEELAAAMAWQAPR